MAAINFSMRQNKDLFYNSITDQRCVVQVSAVLRLYKNNLLTLYCIFNAYQTLFEISDRVLIISWTSTKNPIPRSDYTRRDLMEETR